MSGDSSDQAGLPTAAPKPPSQWRRVRNWFLAALVAGVTTAVATTTANLISSGGQHLSDALSPNSGQTTAASPPPTGLPIGWTVNFTSGRLNECHRWMFTKPIQSIPFHELSTNDGQNSGLWALSQGGVDIGSATYTLTVQGLTDIDVVISNLRIKVLDKQPALHGTTIELGDGCGGAVAIRRYAVNVAAPNPQLIQVSASGAQSALDAQFTVSKSDPEVFQLEGGIGDSTSASTPYSYTFVYQFDWSQAGTSGTVEIHGPDGKPFRLTAGDLGPPYIGVNGSWKDLGKTG